MIRHLVAQANRKGTISQLTKLYKGIVCAEALPNTLAASWCKIESSKPYSQNSYKHVLEHTALHVNRCSTPINYSCRRHYTESSAFKDSFKYNRTHLCSELNSTLDAKVVKVWGWVQAIRNMKGVEDGKFITLRDHSGTAQIIVSSYDEMAQAQWADKRNNDNDNNEMISKSEWKKKIEGIGREQVVHVAGVVRRRPEGAANEAMVSGDVELLLLSPSALSLLSSLPAAHCFPAAAFPIFSFSQIPEIHPNSIPIATANATNLSDEVEHYKHLLHKQQVHEADIRNKLRDETRQKYRIFDLRRPKMQQNIRMRSKASFVVRSFFHDNGFVEIETPSLFKRTAEGAREFIVPTTVTTTSDSISAPIANAFALIQSPQQHKQMLMAAGFEKYFQFARCYRDEAARADRQFEFTQVDIEMSCISGNDIISLIEKLLCELWLKVKHIQLPVPFPRITYKVAMEKYGSDKPDCRFDMTLNNVTATFVDSSLPFLKGACELGDNGNFKGKVIAFNAKGLKKHFSNKIAKQFQTFAVESGLNGIITIHENDGNIKSSIAKHLSGNEFNSLKSQLNFEENDVIFLASSTTTNDSYLVETVLGRARLHAFSILQSHCSSNIIDDQYNLKFLWVYNFPLFEKEDGVVSSTHHPFTCPVPEDVPNLKSGNILNVRGQHYDIVLNGVEIGGGSIRIHEAELQREILSNALSLTDSQLQEFDHLLSALQSGCPPHGGIALGFDRLMSILCGEKSIREVIAFPKSSGGRDLLTNAPSPLSNSDLLPYHLQLLHPPA